MNGCFNSPTICPNFLKEFAPAFYDRFSRFVGGGWCLVTGNLARLGVNQNKVGEGSANIKAKAVLP